MIGLIYDGSNARLESNRSAPVAAPGEALIRLVKGAISAIDIQVCRGLMGFRGVLGQQFVGIVQSVNGPTAASMTGKRAVGSPVIVCGKCDMCLAGLSAHCRHRSIMGLHGRDGCLAELFALPVKNLAIVPDSIDDDHAVFAVELAAAIQAAEQLTIVGKPYITVLGDDSVSLLTAQVMAKLNASVRIVGMIAGQVSICEKWGIKHRHVDDVGMRADQDVVVDCTGTAGGLEIAMKLIRPRGKIVLKGLHAPIAGVPPKTIDLTPVVLNELELIGSFGVPISAALSMLARREVDVLSLISNRMNLNNGPAILKTAAQANVIKVLVAA